MKLKDDFILRNIAGQTVALPSGGDLDLNMMITLNETGAFLWERLQQETDEAALVAALVAGWLLTQKCLMGKVQQSQILKT
jgi:hypothetical protein